MRVKIPYSECDKKSDVQLNISALLEGSLSEEMKRHLDAVSEYIIKSKLSYRGNNQQNYISIKKEEDGIIVEKGNVDTLFNTPKHPYTKLLL